MIKALLIKNFQSHKKTELVFHNGMNVIIGKSDSGKTAIIRALRWLIFNKPGGDSFRSHWGGDTEVTITLNEGNIVSRIKTNSKNMYVLDNPDEPFTAFGKEIPEEIQKILNVSHINLQQQFDKFFLIQNTPGEVASHFNKIAQLDVIDKSLTFLNKGIYHLNSEMKNDKKKIEEKNNELKEFEGLNDFKKEVEKLGELENTFEKKSNEYHILQSNITKFTDNSNIINKLKPVLLMENDVNLVIDLLDKRNKKQIHIAKLNKLFHKIHKINKELKSKSINETLEEDIHFALRLYNTRKTHQQKIDKLNLLINQLIKKSKHLKEIKNKLHQLESKFQNEFPDICPLCNTKLS